MANGSINHDRMTIDSMFTTPFYEFRLRFVTASWPTHMSPGVVCKKVRQVRPKYTQSTIDNFDFELCRYTYKASFE